MSEFLISSELWSNIIGGIVSALILAGFYWIINNYKRKNLNELVIIEKEITKLLDDELISPPDPNEWYDASTVIHKRAITTANKLSPSAGALIESISVQYNGGDAVDHWYPILKNIKSQILEILKAHI